MTSVDIIAVKLPDLDGVIEEYAFILTIKELEAILNLGVNQTCNLPSLDGEAFRGDYGVLNIRYKNAGGHRFASVDFDKAKQIIKDMLLDVGY